MSVGALVDCCLAFKNDELHATVQKVHVQLMDSEYLFTAFNSAVNLFDNNCMQLGNHKFLNSRFG